MNISESDVETKDRADRARLEKIRSLSLIRDAAPPGRPARASRLVLLLCGALAVQTVGLTYFVLLHVDAIGPVQQADGSSARAGAPTRAAIVALPAVPADAQAGAVRLQAQGFVVAMRQATVSARVASIVTSIPVKAGDRVERGQIVGVLNADLAEQDLHLAEKELASLRAQLARERARQEQADSEYQRELVLEKSNFTSRARLDDKKAASMVALASVGSTQAQLEVGEVRVRQQRSLLDNYTIRAPFAGIVIETNSQVGELVAPMSAGGSFTRTGICTIVDMDSLILVVDVSEQQIGKVKVGREVSFQLYLDERTRMKGVVQRIVPSADRAKGTLQVQIAITGKDARTLPGMRANVDFI